MIENIIFLGAGASAAEGAPVQYTMFRDYFIDIQASNRPIDKDLLKYFKEFWNIDLKNDDLNHSLFPSFEEALGLLEIARERQEYFKGFYDTACNNTISCILEKLNSLMAAVLKGKVYRNQHHLRLINGLQKSNLLQYTAFITVNYDLLIDKAIVRHQEKSDGLKDTTLPDYGIPVYLNHSPSEGGSGIKLFKLHGSLNWLYCPVCKTVHLRREDYHMVSPPDHSPHNFLDKTCCSCSSQLVYIYIPPTYFKALSNPYIVQVWNKAEQTIKECRKIMFCGYSLRDTDIHIKYLFKRGILNRISPSSLPKVMVFNGNEQEGKDSENRIKEGQRFYRLFGNQQVDYTLHSFEEFCRRPELYLQ